MNLNNVFRLMNLIDIALSIQNIKLANLAILLFIKIEISSCYNTLSWAMFFLD